MSLSLLILKNGLSLVAQTSELDYEPKVHMIRPYSVSVGKNVVLTQWPVGTDDEHILLRSEELLTVCEPSEQVVKSYLRKTGLTMKDLTEEKKEEPVPVAEQERDYVDEVPLTEPDIMYDEDDYEPRYVES